MDELNRSSATFVRKYSLGFLVGIIEAKIRERTFKAMDRWILYAAGVAKKFAVILNGVSKAACIESWNCEKKNNASSKRI